MIYELIGKIISIGMGMLMGYIVLKIGSYILWLFKNKPDDITDRLTSPHHFESTKDLNTTATSELFGSYGYIRKPYGWDDDIKAGIEPLQITEAKQHADDFDKFISDIALMTQTMEKPIVKDEIKIKSNSNVIISNCHNSTINIKV